MNDTQMAHRSRTVGEVGVVPKQHHGSQSWNYKKERLVKSNGLVNVKCNQEEDEMSFETKITVDF